VVAAVRVTGQTGGADARSLTGERPHEPEPSQARRGHCITLTFADRRPNVDRIEPVIPVALGCHGLAICALTDAPVWAVPPFVAVVLLGLFGLVRPPSPRARLLRALVCTAVPLTLSITAPMLVPALLQWYYAVAALYSLVLWGWMAAVIAPLTGLAYVVQVQAGAVPVPPEVAVLRAAVLIVLGYATGSAGVAYRAAVREAELGRAAAERTTAERTHAATHDALTGLANRDLLHERITAVLGDSNGLAALLLLDLDRFKEVNDTLGHAYGDLLLQQVAHRLVAATPERATVARLGGDEFAVLLPGGEAEQAGAVATVVRMALQQPFQVEEALIALDASVGLALAPLHATTSHRLLQVADVAMYAAKDGGLGSCLYRPPSNGPSPARLMLLAELRGSIDRDELFVEYQPIVAVASGILVGHEALVRWQHPVRGRLGPDEFIPLAERSGFIHPLTSFVLHTALRACAGWQPEQPGIRVSVNLSARNLQQDDLPAVVRAALAEHDLPARLLELELTESFLMADPDRALILLTELHGLGVRLAIDDFGTGHSSLSYVRNLPVDVLKIDRSFISGMQTNSKDAHIVRAIIDLAGSLGVETVAEGVEDPGTVLALRQIHCTYAQGFGIGRPMSSDALDKWSRARTEAVG